MIEGGVQALDLKCVDILAAGDLAIGIVRVLKPGGRLVIADFKRPEERAAQAVRFGAGGSRIRDLAALVKDAGFSRVETEEMRLPRFPAHSGGFVGFIRADKD